MRPGNVIGPIVLIGIGVIFLLNNFVARIPFGRVFADFWPVILMVIGFTHLLRAIAGNPFRRWGFLSGGVILITLGLLFQIQELHIARFGKTWPALLIVVGGLGLVRAVVGSALFPSHFGPSARGGFPR
jgi:hypothetical protein